jgi:hypothetical protein
MNRCAVPDPDVRAKIEERGRDVQASWAEVYRRFLAAEIDQWGRVIRTNSITTDS